MYIFRFNCFIDHIFKTSILFSCHISWFVSTGKVCKDAFKYKLLILLNDFNHFLIRFSIFNT
ncbi:Uncharacterised protein [Klebsiella pneumoniae]|nr:Uncharacterised protein [Klebsiella pneumoniae]